MFAGPMGIIPKVRNTKRKITLVIRKMYKSVTLTVWRKWSRLAR